MTVCIRIILLSENYIPDFRLNASFFHPSFSLLSNISKRLQNYAFDCTKQAITAGRASAVLLPAAVHKMPKYGVYTPAAARRPVCVLFICITAVPKECVSQLPAIPSPDKGVYPIVH